MAHHAIVVGINNYPDLGHLDGAENDALAFDKWLRVDAGLNEKKITLIKSSDYQTPAGRNTRTQPVFDDIDDAFTNLRLIALANEGFVGERLYIYMSGHGMSQDINEASLIMANANKLANLPSYPGRRAADRLREAAMFDEIVLFMDCCRDLSFIGNSHPLDNWVLTKDPAGANVKHFFGFATKWAKKAREKFDQETNEVRGRFTKALIKGLKGGKTDENNQVTSSSLEDFIFNYLSNEVTRGEVDAADSQEPEFIYNKRQQIIFTTNIAEGRTIVNFTHNGKKTADEPLTIVDSESRDVVTFKAGTVLTHSFGPGMYEALLRGNSVKFFEVIGKEEANVEL